MILWPNGNKTRKLWAPQTHTDSELEEKIEKLQQATQWLGDQFLALQLQIMLHCDWNVTQYCVTPIHYNQTKYQ